MKKFEKVEKTRIISTKFLLLCTPSVILGQILKNVTKKFSEIDPKIGKEIVPKIFHEIFTVHMNLPNFDATFTLIDLLP